MPKKKHLEESGGVAVADRLTGASPNSGSVLEPLGGATVTSIDVKRAPAAMIGSPREHNPTPLPPPDSLGGITARLGARLWATNKRFEWARMPNNHHYEFTRFYFEQNVLVDVWPNANNSARREAEKKLECVDAENRRRVAAGEKPIGLLSVVRGAVVPDECFDAALRGETMALIEPAARGVLT
jgi:hypothetical protein